MRRTSIGPSPRPYSRATDRCGGSNDDTPCRDCDPAFIGRHLDECHGPCSRDLIARLQDEFRAGHRDEALFWGDDDGRLILSRYAAVRDAHGACRGILETRQDITDLQTTEGERHGLER